MNAPSKTLLERCRDFISGPMSEWYVGELETLLADLDAAIAEEGALHRIDCPGCGGTFFERAAPKYATTQQPATQTNQCDGCQRQLPTSDLGNHIDDNGPFGCTADRYAPTATSGMPEMPAGLVMGTYNNMKLVMHTPEQMQSHSTACYAAGRRQGLEEAQAECAEMARDLRNHDRVRMAAGKLRDRIVLLQTRGKNDSGVL